MQCYCMFIYTLRIINFDKIQKRNLIRLLCLHIYREIYKKIYDDIYHHK